MTQRLEASIPCLRQTRKLSWVVIRKLSDHLVAEVFPFFWDCFAKERENGSGELLLAWVVAIVRYILVQDGPKALDRVEVRTIRRQLD